MGVEVGEVVLVKSFLIYSKLWNNISTINCILNITIRLHDKSPSQKGLTKLIG